ncbi:universal stress protein [Oryzicola mucosus]|uniref:Universal stress protein n=1 Tax=Oryzicola mucosus TaxID=2767425 RepID=A0A8J6PVN7_9HYPH|nr:universal stress protein [Oryzicola mucosus]MBD0415142.1 universal stress protein [Oryzicola mucosus]
MTIQTYLPLVTYPDANSLATIKNAVTVSKLLNATLNAQAFDIVVPPVSNAFSQMLLNLPEMIMEAEELSAHHGARLLQAVDEQARSASVPFTITVAKAPLTSVADRAAAQARYYDLALIGCSPDNTGAQMVAEALVFGAGRPALLIPESISLSRLDHVVIAWDGSRVAARAVSDALPLLDRAVRISVVTATGEKHIEDEQGAERLAESLRRGGLLAEWKTIPAGTGRIGDILQQHAGSIGANVLVMGGYGHSRLRDFVLGGATAGVLGNLQLPVMLSH